MPRFSKRSKEILETCDPQLIRIFNEVILTFDCTIISGYRDEKEQNSLVDRGLSKLRFPDSKHNVYPSLAVDAVPYPINWHDRERMTLFAGFVLGTAIELTTQLRWGGDWNMNWEVRDNNFDDLAHFELLRS